MHSPMLALSSSECLGMPRHVAIVACSELISSSQSDAVGREHTQKGLVALVDQPRQQRWIACAAAAAFRGGCTSRTPWAGGCWCMIGRLDAALSELCCLGTGASGGGMTRGGGGAPLCTALLLLLLGGSGGGEAATLTDSWLDPVRSPRRRVS